MNTSIKQTLSGRRGAVSILVLLLLMTMIVLAVFAVDYGYLLVVRTNLQRAADNAALAAVQELVPDAFGVQRSDDARAAARQYAALNLGEVNFNIADEDIEIGRFNPDTIYSGLELLDTGTYDTVRVTLRRDDLNNSSVSLYLARVLGINSAAISASATAVLQKARSMPPGADILPIALPIETWNRQSFGDEWSIYGDGRLLDAFDNEVPGNWGTLDVGKLSNSTADIVDQVLNGLRQTDLDHMASEGVIPDSTSIDSQHAMWLNGDTGFSAGMKDAIKQSHGTTKLIPIFDVMSPNPTGGTMDFHVVGWGVVEIVDSFWSGGKTSRVEIRKSYNYDGELRPNADLSNTTDIIIAAFTSPMLVE